MLSERMLCRQCASSNAGALEALSAEEGRQRQLRAYAGADVLAGVQWMATMSLHTPLRSLQRHGDVFRGDPREAPMYGTAAEGTWVPLIDWDSVGLPAPDPGEMWSVVGKVPSDGGAFLAFLLRFRAIVESDLAIDQQLEQIGALCASSAEFRAIAKRIAESRDAGQSIGGADFAKKFFAQRFQDIPGIGPDTALRLFNAGFRTWDDLAAASDADLEAVHGVGPSLITKIRTHLR